MIVRGKQNKQNRNWFYFNLSFESSSFIFNNFKTEKNKSLPLKDETDQFVTCLVLPECPSVKIAFHPRTVKRIVMALACVAGGISRVRAFVLVAKPCGETVRGLVKSPVEFPPAQIRGVF